MADTRRCCLAIAARDQEVSAKVHTIARVRSLLVLLQVASPSDVEAAGLAMSDFRYGKAFLLSSAAGRRQPFMGDACVAVAAAGIALARTADCVCKVCCTWQISSISKYP